MKKYASAITLIRRKGNQERALLNYRAKPEYREHNKLYMREYRRRKNATPVHCVMCGETFMVAVPQDWQEHKINCIGFKVER